MNNNKYSRRGRVGGTYYTREQRLNQISDALQRRWFEDEKQGWERWFSVHDIAHMVDMRPSHHVRGLIHELCSEGYVDKRGGVGRGVCKIRRDYRARMPTFPF